MQVGGAPTFPPTWTPTFWAVVADVDSPTGFVAQMDFPNGMTAGKSMNLAERDLSGGDRYRYLKLTFGVKFSAVWYANPIVNKIIHFLIGSTGGTNHGFIAAEGAAGGGLAAPLPFYFDVQGIQNLGGSTSFPPNLVPTAKFIRGTRHVVQVILDAGSASGVADGSFDWYLDGTHVGTQSGVKWLAAADGPNLWTGFQWSPTWGGGGAALTQDQQMSVDSFVGEGRN